MLKLLDRSAAAPLVLGALALFVALSAAIAWRLQDEEPPEPSPEPAAESSHQSSRSSTPGLSRSLDLAEPWMAPTLRPLTPATKIPPKLPSIETGSDRHAMDPEEFQFRRLVRHSLNGQWQAHLRDRIFPAALLHYNRQHRLDLSMVEYLCLVRLVPAC